MKPVRLRSIARRDVENAVDHYLLEGGLQVGLGFIDDLERVYGLIARQPGAGSPRYAGELDLAGLRSRGLRRYPYLVFYLNAAEHIEVWRVLHAHRDIPVILRGSAQKSQSSTIRLCRRVSRINV